jgi:hypothetical protein
MKYGKARTAAAALLLAGGALVAVAAPSSAAVCCEGRNHFKGDGVNIRSCASSSCASLGLGYKSQYEATVCAGTEDQNGYEHIKDLDTGVVGWAANQYVELLACD